MPIEITRFFDWLIITFQTRSLNCKAHPGIFRCLTLILHRSRFESSSSLDLTIITSLLSLCSSIASVRLIQEVLEAIWPIITRFFVTKMFGYLPYNIQIRYSVDSIFLYWISSFSSIIYTHGVNSFHVSNSDSLVSFEM